MNGPENTSQPFRHPGTDYMSLSDQMVVSIGPHSPQPATREQLNQFNTTRCSCAHTLTFATGAATLLAGIIAQASGVPCHISSPIICVGGSITFSYALWSCCFWWGNLEGQG